MYILESENVREPVMTRTMKRDLGQPPLVPLTIPVNQPSIAEESAQRELT